MTEEIAKQQKLGRGLAALLDEETEDYASGDDARTFRVVPVETLHPNRYQPRRQFDEDEIVSLAESIRQRGLLQPILVRRADTGGANTGGRADGNDFEIVAGERRWRAAQLAQLHEVPIVIKEMDDAAALEIALVENLQRVDLSPLEEGEGYRRLQAEFTYGQEDVARVVGRSRSHVANTLRLLDLPGPVKEMLEGRVLTAGHARALLGAADPVALAHQVAARGLNVRQTEGLVRRAAEGGAKAPFERDPDTVALEHDLAELVGLKVAIRVRGEGGAITFHYDKLEQLDDLLHRLTLARAG